MSRSLLARYVLKPLRPLLLKLVSLAEKEHAGGMPSAQRTIFLQNEIRVPTWLAALASWAMLFVVLFLEIGPGWPAALGLLFFTGMLLTLFIIYFRRDLPDLCHDEDAVALLGVLVVGSVWMMEVWREVAQMYDWVSPFGLPLAAASILTALLLKPRLAVILTVVLGAIYGLINNFSLEAAMVAGFGGLTGVARCLEARTRRDITRAGLWVALAQGMAVAILALLQRWDYDEALFTLAWVVMGGFLSSLLALGLLPSLESFFSRLTNIRLLELSDVNHPLLERMSLEAPGTYHHSLIMASLAQAAAEAIDANGLLCRVGAYFHDIGKLTKPEYFVENQGALGNPHDPLPPSMSRLVIQSHVKEGTALARQFGLDKAISDFITMHHGTSRIEYFYRRAIERSEDPEAVDEDEYRYPGPRPQTKETAILMLADSVEASCRALEDPTPQRLSDQVKKIVETKMSDGQFDEVPLTLAEVNKVVESFTNTLVGVYHSRIKYPDAAAAPEPPGPPPASQP